MLLSLSGLELPRLDKESTLVLTPNNRIMRKFLAAYENDQIAHGKNAWRTPSVVPISGWVLESAYECQDKSIPPLCNLQILNNEQELILWQRIAAEAKSQALERKEVFAGKVSQVAKNAYQAYSLMHQWLANFNSSDFIHNPEGEVFIEWSENFNALCDSQELVSMAKLPSLITEAIRNGSISAPEDLVLFAFDDISPAYKDLFSAFKEKGTTIYEADPKIDNISLVRTSMVDSDDEIRTAALWSKKIIESDNNAVVGIVVPELTRYRNTVLRHFADVFEPQNILPETPRYTLPFNISAGVSFTSVPVIADAFNILKLDNYKLTLEDAISIIRSPFIPYSRTEMTARCVAEGKLRKSRKSIFTVKDILDAIDNCPKLTHVLQEYIGQKEENGTKLPSQWAFIINEKLKIAGWPGGARNQGGRNLDSEEYQAVMHWTTLLDKVGEMDMVGHISFSKAVELLKNLASASIFQPKMADSPIQILGSLEAAGLQFTHLWVLGLHDEVWPAIAKPNPYIPLNLQRNPGSMSNGKPKPSMPHSSAERELEYAKNLTNRYIRSAQHIVFSNPYNDSDRELRTSPLITHIEHTDKANLLLAKNFSYANVVHDEVENVFVNDEKSSPIAKGENVPGGTDVLKTFSECPFKAFAKHRLKAKPFKEPRIALDASDRGVIVHSIAQKMWEELDNSENLKRVIENNSLESLIHKQVTQVLDKYSTMFDILNSKAFYKLEQERLNQIFLQHFKVESQRAPFKVAGVEKEVKSRIGEHYIDLKIDRIDESSEGLILIDYKTSRTSISSWAGDRPDQPQLPIYAVHHEKNVAAISFSQIRVGETFFNGVGASENISEGIVSCNKASRYSLPDNWKECVENWKKTLETMLHMYTNGYSFPEPKKNNKTCIECDYAAICRHDSHR